MTPQYRVWNPKTKEFNPDIWMYQDGTLDHDTMVRSELDHCVVQRYTGVKDRKGENLYVGDVIIFIDDRSKKTVIEKWGMFGYESVHIFRHIPGSDFFTIVGNIFENPEFL